MHAVLCLVSHCIKLIDRLILPLIASCVFFFCTQDMDQVMQYVEPAKQFAKDSIRLVKRCTKPDRKEFQKIAMATAIGFAIMGFIGFFVKLIHIPINNIIVYVVNYSFNKSYVIF